MLTLCAGTKTNERTYQLDILTRAEFAALAGGLHVDARIIFDHGPDRAAIHHYIKDMNVRYTLSLYPVFDSISITRLGSGAKYRQLKCNPEPMGDSM